MNAIPRSSSTVISLQLCTPPAVANDSAGQVSAPNSPRRGTVWKTHANFPVTTLNAWMSAGDERYDEPLAGRGMMNVSR